MRIFNTSGACVPEEHYTVMREALVAEGEELVRRGRFFTIFAPRQAGKTTYFQLLFRQLAQFGYLPVWVSFEGMKTATRQEFYTLFSHELQRELGHLLSFEQEEFANHIQFQWFLERLHTQTSRLVLVIDEFEDIPDVVLSELLHTFRKIYQRKQYYALYALILVGVSTLTELVVSAASPFNVVDQLQIPYFTVAEVQELIQQYVSENGQPFDPQVIKAIYDNTQGQPGLVNALCQHLVDFLNLMIFEIY